MRILIERGERNKERGERGEKREERDPKHTSQGATWHGGADL